MKKLYIIGLFFLSQFFGICAENNELVNSVDKRVYVPDQIRSVAEFIAILKNQQNEDLTFLNQIIKKQWINYIDATEFIHHMRDWLSSHTYMMREQEYEQMQTYLDQYELFINTPEALLESTDSSEEKITRGKYYPEYKVMLDLWVQHALRARLIRIDEYLDISGNLDVGGTETIAGNLVVGGNTLIGGNLTVDGIANFTEVFVGNTGSCTGLLSVCGTFILNGQVITGAFGPQGPSGPQGPTGPQGPAGPTGPQGVCSGTTAATFQVTSTTPSTGCTTGALVVNGGVGIAGNLNVCGYINTFVNYRIDTTRVLDATGTNLTVGFNSGGVNFGTGNSMVGNFAGQSITSSAANDTFVGYQSGQATTSGIQNTYVGTQAGNNLTTGNNNVLVGYEAGANATSTANSNNTFVGVQAGSNLLGSDNVIMGYLAANATAGGLNQSIVIGEGAGEFSSGTGQTFIGLLAGQQATGTENTLIGYQAGNNITTSFGNTFVGYEAGFNAADPTNASSDNTCIGVQAGEGIQGALNVLVGNRAGQNPVNPLDQSVCVGVQSGLNTSGVGNTFVGYNAGNGDTGAELTLLGFSTHASAGGFTNATALGASSTVTASNLIQLGAANTNVQVTTPGSTAGLLLPNPGTTFGSNTTLTLNFYQQDIVNFTFQWTSDGHTSGSTPVLFTRIGNIVFMTVSSFAIGDAEMPSTISIFSGTVPAQYISSNAITEIAPLVGYENSVPSIVAQFVGLITTGTGQINISWANETAAPGTPFQTPKANNDFPDPEGFEVIVSPFTVSYAIS